MSGAVALGLVLPQKSLPDEIGDEIPFGDLLIVDIEQNLA